MLPGFSLEWFGFSFSCSFVGLGEAEFWLDRFSGLRGSSLVQPCFRLLWRVKRVSRWDVCGAGPVLGGGGHSRLHFPRDTAGDGGRDGSLRAGVWLVVSGSLHVWDAVRGNAVLCWVAGGNIRQDYEPWGQKQQNIYIKCFMLLFTLFLFSFPSDVWVK